MTTIEQRVEYFFRDHYPSACRKSLVVAVSGGPDSVCLLHVLNTIKETTGCKLHVAHLDHQLRGNESIADAQYVLDLCHKMKIPVTIEQSNVRAYQKEHGLSMEEAAREVRYNFLGEVAKDIGTEYVVTGHTLDDHVETIILNLLRGTGTRGLRGLQPIRRWQASGRHFIVLRPLLDVNRKETQSYCRQHGLQPRTDLTNRSLELTRNRIRLKLLPLLKRYNPDIIAALLRTARIAGDDIAFLEQTTDRYYRRIADRQGEVIALEKIALLKLTPSIQRLVLRRAIEDILGTLKDIEARHIEEMMMLLEKPAGKQISLPYGLFFVSEYERFLLGEELEKSSPFPLFQGEHYIKVPAEMKIGEWRVQAQIIPPPKRIHEDKFTVYLDAEVIKGQLSMRTRKPGDRFLPLGMEEEKKVGRFMMDEHIPQMWRGNVPIVSDAEKIIWVVGYRIDERVKVTENTRRVLRLKFKHI